MMISCGVGFVCVCVCVCVCVFWGGFVFAQWTDTHLPSSTHCRCRRLRCSRDDAAAASDGVREAAAAGCVALAMWIKSSHDGCEDPDALAPQRRRSRRRFTNRRDAAARQHAAQLRWLRNLRGLRVLKQLLGLSSPRRRQCRAM